VDGERQIFLTDPDGAPVVQLTRESRGAGPPAWSPDGRRLAYLTGAGSAGAGPAQVVQPGVPFLAAQLVIIAADGSGRRVVADRLSTPLGGSDLNWSPDGSRLLFTGPGSGSFDRGDVWVVNADGSGARSLTNDASGLDSGAEWSPDGNRIVYGHTVESGPTGESSTIRVMNADGSGQVVVAGPFANVFLGKFSWAPNGGRIVYHRGPPSGNANIFALDPDGSNQVQLTTTGDNGAPAWSPDGSRIAFTSDRDGAAFGSVYTMRPDGSGVSMTTTGRADVVAGWGSGSLLADRSVGAKLVRGVVRVRAAGGRRFVRFTGTGQILYGSLVDTRRGRIRITADAGGTKIERADFYAGLFKLVRRRGARPVTEAVLAGKLEGCRRARAGAATARAAATPGRRLWGSGKGRFRTRGRHSAATVTGTVWLVEDRCDGSTLTRVASGRVAVRDFVRRRTITLRRGQRYVAGR
jgi:hypothetical protein